MVRAIRQFGEMTAIPLISLLVFCCCSVPGVRTSTGVVLIHGRVVLFNEALPGVRVGAYLRPDFSGTPVFSTVTDQQGWYRLTVKPGRYYLAVRDLRRGLFSYSGLNPIEAGAGSSMEIGFKASPISRAVSRNGDPGEAAIEGRITADGEPLLGGQVYLYLDHADDFRGPGYAFSFPAGSDGRFAIDGIPPGSYYVIGRKRIDQRRAGPVFSGEFFGYYHDNPVDVKNGMIVQIEVPCVAKKKGMFPYLGATIIRGTIRDVTGRTMAGVYAFAYSDEVVGHAKPSAMSTVTGADGTYSLSLNGGGIYYVGAREYYGANPQPGEWYGLYPETPDHSIVIDTGANLSGVDIVVEKILGWEE